MADLYLRRTLTGFDYADEESRELGRGYRIGDVVKATIVKPRDMTSLKHFQALVQVTYENLPVRYHQMWPTRRKFRRMLADAVGHVEEFVTQDGEK